MKNILIVASFGALVACGGTSIDMAPDGGISSGQGIQASGGGGNQTGAPVTSNRDQTFGTILNNVRIGNGASAVTYDSRLDAAAQSHADDMVARGYFAHLSPEGNDVEDRIRAQGYSPIAWGENLAGGQQSEGAVLNAWENSAPHDRMMNAESLEEFGLGVAGTGSDTRWVLVMGTEG